MGSYFSKESSDESVVSIQVSEPVATEPIASEPVATEPIASEPVATEPIASEPVATEPIASEPVASEPVASEPVASEPVNVKESNDMYENTHATDSQLFYDCYGYMQVGEGKTRIAMEIANNMYRQPLTIIAPKSLKAEIPKYKGDYVFQPSNFSVVQTWSPSNQVEFINNLCTMCRKYSANIFTHSTLCVECEIKKQVHSVRNIQSAYLIEVPDDLSDITGILDRIGTIS
jgi:hypothetical protein